MGSCGSSADSCKSYYNPPGAVLTLLGCSLLLRTYQSDMMVQSRYFQSGFAHCGTGQWTLSQTHNYILILNGMPSGFLDVLERQLLMCIMSLGQVMHFGIFRYAITVVATYAFTKLIVLNGIILVSNPTGCTSIMFHSLCRQDEPVLFWHSKRLSSDCTLCKPTCLNPEWQWYWWWVCYWMAANCMYCSSECLHVLMTSIGPRNSRGHSEASFCQIQMRSLA